MRDRLFLDFVVKFVSHFLRLVSAFGGNWKLGRYKDSSGPVATNAVEELLNLMEHVGVFCVVHL